MNKQLQQQNFDEQDITSGFVMNLIKLTQQNIRLGKQTINNERELCTLTNTRLFHTAEDGTMENKIRKQK
tara:strand:+ start:339 stop:548 length:210 start_codon:yes stop_codon:yes gene_type:complete